LKPEEQESFLAPVFASLPLMDQSLNSMSSQPYDESRYLALKKMALFLNELGLRQMCAKKSLTVTEANLSMYGVKLIPGCLINIPFSLIDCSSAY
jgi:hypothetical protein